MIESIEADDGTLLAIVVGADAFPTSGTRFVTRDEEPLQFGLLAYEAGDGADVHAHPSELRRIDRLQEAIHVETGVIELEVVDEDGDRQAVRTLEAGDSAFFAAGGRGWSAVRDAEIIEIKQGPYEGENKVLL